MMPCNPLVIVESRKPLEGLYSRERTSSPLRVGTGQPHHSASALASLIESKEASPVEVVAAYLQRIDELDFKFKSFVTVLHQRALEEARQAEQEILAGNYCGRMQGIPVGVEDQIWTKDIRTAGGARITADFVPDDDATVVSRLKDASAIVLCKTNLSESAITGFTHRFSNPRNPWDLNISAGGSSGGSGAATAAFLCATSLGEDTGGSIRRPAAWCRIVGLGPGWGRVSRYGLMRGVWSMDTIGPISRTVEDAAITLPAIAGHDPKDPTTWNPAVHLWRGGPSFFQGTKRSRGRSTIGTALCPLNPNPPKV